MSDINWPAIEKAFCLGGKSFRELGREFGCSDTIIRKRAAKFAWQVLPAGTRTRIISSGIHPQCEPPANNTREPAPPEPVEAEDCAAETAGSAVVNQAMMARIAGVTVQTISTWMADGLPHFKPAANRCSFNLIDAVVWIRDNKWASADDKERLNRIKADDAQLDFDLKLGTLMKVSEATHAWENTCAMMRARLLSIPPVAQQRLGLSIPQVLGLTSLVHEVLEVLSGRIEAPPDEDAPAEAEEKPLPVGHKRSGPKRKH